MCFHFVLCKSFGIWDRYHADLPICRSYLYSLEHSRYQAPRRVCRRAAWCSARRLSPSLRVLDRSDSENAPARSGLSRVVTIFCHVAVLTAQGRS